MNINGTDLTEDQKNVLTYGLDVFRHWLNDQGYNEKSEKTIEIIEELEVIIG
ncbi:MAG: hypothetical protein GY853_13150 [PVC group bacterium]|nr:hypothetical protein [PVC group bacterium]